MTAEEVQRDQKTVADYAAIARRLASGRRTDWHGRNGGTIDPRSGRGALENDAVRPVAKTVPPRTA